ncbi:MAG: diguanylate cyclase [Candidatus Latescibacteria bacterium]|nr:diguanylate cyclase [Candidatus Latescibacterota bacterium]
MNIFRGNKVILLKYLSSSLLTFFYVIIQPYITDAKIRFDRFDVRDGLSDNTVTSICRGSKGFMWFGTTNGLNRFDGYSYIHFKHDLNDSTSISDNYIQDIFEDKSGNLWIGTLNGGLNRFERDSESFVRYMHDPDNPEGISSNLISSITEGKDGTIWVATDYGLNALDRNNGTFRRYYHDPSDATTINNNNIGCVYADKKGDIWIGTHYGLNIISFDTGKVKRLADRNSDTSKINQNIIDIVEGDDEILWLSTWGGGLRKYDPKTDTYCVFQYDPNDPGSIRSNIVGHISFDNNGILWFGTAQGLHTIDPSDNTIEHYSHEPTDQFSISTDSIWAVYHDRSGIGWVGTLFGGGNKIVPSKSIFRLYSLEEIYAGATKGGFINEFCEAGSSVWLTSNYGLHRLDINKQSFSLYTPEDNNKMGLETLLLRTIFNDDSGHLWFGTSIVGLIRFDIDTGSFTSFQHNDLISSVISLDVTSVNKDSDDLFWLGTNLGILTFNPQTESFSKIDIDDNENDKMKGVSNIIFDSDGTTVWISGQFGLSQYNRKSKNLSFIFSNNRESRSLSSNFISCMLDDGQGSIWLGTNDGLYSYGKKTKILSRYTLPNSTVNGLIQDKKDNIWASTNAGLSRIKLSTKEILNYDSGDGLPSDQNMNLSMYCGSDGTIFVGGHNGFYTFLPDSIFINNDPPPVVITSFKIDNVEAKFEKKISELTEIGIPYKNAPLTFEFAALDYSNPMRNVYEYKMEGLNDNWIQSGNERKVIYTNIAPGLYTFRVKAANSQGVWNQKGVSLRITIIPPFWKTVWFKLIILAISAAAMYAAYNASIIAMKRQRENLKKLVDKQTSDLRKINEKLEQLAVIDALTQINNRRNFNTYIDSQWKIAARDKTPLSLIIGDIDYFKNYNDCYGHQKGDQCLYQVAQILKNQINRPQDFVARYGGEEFVIVLPNSPREGAKHVAARLIDEIRSAAIPHEKSKINNIVTLSVGVATVYPDMNNNPSTVMKLADDALYEAKNQGRDRMVVCST